MTPETTLYELFEQYLGGDLNAAEKAAFEQRLQTEPEVQALFTDYKNIQTDFIQYESAKPGEAALTGTLTELNREHFAAAAQPATAKVVSMKRRFYMIAAAASLIMGFFLLKPLFFTSQGNLFNKYYDEEGLSVSRGETDTASTVANFYNQKEYAKALTLLEPYTEAHPTATDLLMAKGVCYLQTGRFAEADAVFAPVAASATVYSQRAQWLQAMVQLKQANKPACKTILEKINNTSAYYERAQRLLKAIR
jgi:tetratricopeptide (TPR) repeat protein